jgi:BirA family transcriptional regulator, biotin operon repressor / biotin---[acetyl-CoA-carboxylase] ligase
MAIGSNIISLYSVDSTNNYAASSLFSPIMTDGTVIMAHKQTDGRGQRGAEWFSTSGLNLTFSVVLYPQSLRAANQFLLSKVISIAIVNFLDDSFKISAQIKWPNDILVKGKKIAGILIENTVKDGMVAATIIGVGFNVNENNFPENINATSLFLETGSSFDVKNCLMNLLKHIDTNYSLLLNGSTAELDKQYCKYLFRFGILSSYVLKGENIEAKITSISPRGQLVLTNTIGQEIFCDIKEVQFL